MHPNCFIPARPFYSKRFKDFNKLDPNLQQILMQHDRSLRNLEDEIDEFVQFLPLCMKISGGGEPFHGQIGGKGEINMPNFMALQTERTKNKSDNNLDTFFPPTTFNQICEPENTWNIKISDNDFSSKLLEKIHELPTNYPRGPPPESQQTAVYGPLE